MSAAEQAREILWRFSKVSRPLSKKSTVEIFMHEEHVRLSSVLCIEYLIENVSPTWEEEDIQYLKDILSSLDKSKEHV